MEHLEYFAPMLHAAKLKFDKDVDPSGPYRKQTYPHAEAGAIYQFERNLADTRTDLSKEERKRIALQQFDKKNLYTYGIRSGVGPAEHQPCHYQCARLIEHIMDDKKRMIMEDQMAREMGVQGHGQAGHSRS